MYSLLGAHFSTVLGLVVAIVACTLTTQASGQMTAPDAQGGAADSARVRPQVPAAVVTSTGLPPTQSRVELVSNLDGLRRALDPGDFVWIVRTNGQTMHGRVRRIGTADIDIRVDSQDAAGQARRHLELTIPLGDIRSLERPRDSTRNGTIWGAAVGAGMGLGLFVHAYAIDANEMDEWAAGYAVAACVTTGIGALVGWAIDAARSKPHLWFDARSAGKPLVSVGPLLSYGRGVGIVVSF